MPATAVRTRPNPLAQYQECRERWQSDPLTYVRLRFGIEPTWQQAQILEAIAPPGAKVTVRSGHGIGKSSTAAFIVLWFLETHDYAKVPCTAPTFHQLRDILWGELSKWRRIADAVSVQRGDHPRFALSQLFRLTYDSLVDPMAREWGAFARTAKKENPEALQGFHGDSLLYIVDESSGVPEEVFEAAEGALSTPNARVLLLGNPTRNSGTFAASHKHNRGVYTALHFRSQDSPLVDTSYRDRLVQKWGEGSNVVRVRADGEFPKQEDDVLISLELTEPCTQREARQGEGRRRLGVDVARLGADRTALVLRQGSVVDHIKVYAKQDTMQTVGCILAVLDAWQVEEIAVDVVGLGAGVYDRLAELRRQGVFRWPVIPVNVATKAPPVQHPADAKPRLLRDHLWLTMAQWLREEAPVFCAEDRSACEDLAGELASVGYRLDSQGHLVVEDKDSMRKRLGMSPDCFVAGTLVRTPSGCRSIESLSVGDMVATPMGPRSILYVWETTTEHLTQVAFSNGKRLCGKGKHQIFTWDSGWIRLDALSLVNTIESDNPWRRFLWLCRRKLCMPVKPFGFKHQVDIISQGEKMRRSDFFIDASMRTIMARFLRIMTSIMITTIGKIIGWKTLCWCLVPTMQGTIWLQEWQHRKGWRMRSSDCRRRARQQKRGMPLKKAEPGMSSMAKKPGKIARWVKHAVFGVRKRSSQYFPLAPGFVRMRAIMLTPTNSIRQLLAYAIAVGRVLLPIGIGSKPIVPVSVQSSPVLNPVMVYNLTLDGDNVYYANGVLVANCADALGCTFAQDFTPQAGTWGR